MSYYTIYAEIKQPEPEIELWFISTPIIISRPKTFPTFHEGLIIVGAQLENYSFLFISRLRYV